MAVHFTTTHPKDLLAQFDARIAQTEPKGKITTWVKSDDGKFYTHKAQDWAKKAWFQPKIEKDQLTFNIIRPKNANISVTVYGYYHGHLIETFLNHFDDRFGNAVASAKPEAGDIVQA